MSLPRFIAFLAAVSAPLVSGLAQTEPAPAPAPDASAPAAATSGADPAVLPGMTEADKARILEKVAQMQKDFERQKREVTASALSRFESAASSEGAAVEFYLSCQKIIQDRTPDLDPSNDKQEAKAAQAHVKQQVESYEAAPGRATALKTQLEYLVLTVKAPTVKDRGTLVSEVRDVVAKAMNVEKSFAAPNVDPVTKVPMVQAGKGKVKQQKPANNQQRDKEEERARRQITQTMKQGVMGTVFAQAYNLKNYFKPVDSWSDSPLELNGVYEGFVLPWYRENKRESLNDMWDEYVGHTLALHRCEQGDTEFAKWGITGYKDLLWAKWIDLLKYGRNRTMALDELGKLVKENPTHPNLQTWVNELSQLAESIQVPVAAETPPTVAEPQNAEAAK